MPIPALEIEAQRAVSALNGRKNGTAVPTLWSERFAQRTQRMTSSVIRELLKLTEKPDVISFAGGLPAPEVFPFAEVERATETVLREQGKTALQYAADRGLPAAARAARAAHGALRHQGEARERDDHLGLAAGSRPHRQALREPGRPHPHRVADLPRGAAGVERVPGRLPHRADRRRRARRGAARGAAAGRAEVPLHPARTSRTRRG